MHVQGTYALFFTDIPNTYAIVTAKGAFLQVTDTPLSITSDPTYVIETKQGSGRRLNGGGTIGFPNEDGLFTILVKGKKFIKF